MRAGQDTRPRLSAATVAVTLARRRRFAVLVTLWVGRHAAKRTFWQRVSHSWQAVAGVANSVFDPSPLYLAIAGHEAVGKPIGGREPAAPQGE